jgi:hypothetical protein
VNNRIAVEIIHGGHEAILELLLGSDADVAQDGTREFGKKSLCEISQSRARRRRCARDSLRPSICRAQLLQILALQCVLQNFVPNRLGVIG